MNDSPESHGYCSSVDEGTNLPDRKEQNDEKDSGQFPIVLDPFDDQDFPSVDTEKDKRYFECSNKIHFQTEDLTAEKRMRSFAFAKRGGYRNFAFAKRGAVEDGEEGEAEEVEKRARFAFAKRAGYNRFAFAKRGGPYGFAFAKRGQYSFA